MSKVTLNNITGGYAAVDLLNENFDAIEAAFENTLSRNGAVPNPMLADFDLNHKDILNGGEINAQLLVLNGQPVTPGTLNYNGVVKETQTATSGQTIFNLASITYSPLVNNLSVYVDGVYQNPTRYTETSATRVTFSEGLHVGAVVDFVVLSLNELGSTTDAANVSYSPSGTSLYGTTARTLKSALDDISHEETGASIVGFKASGTSAVARTSQDKLRESVSVKDFGAVGDGVTDDTVAFQNAINAASTGNQSLFVPSGTYYLTNSLNMPTVTAEGGGLVMVGEGLGSILKFNTTNDCIKVPAGSLFQNYQLQFSGLNFQTVTSVPRSFIWNDRAVNTLIEKCFFMYSEVDVACIINDNAYGLTVRNCVFFQITGTCIYLGSAPDLSTYSYVISIEDCDMSTVTIGVAIAGTSDFQMVNTVIQEANYGIYADPVASNDQAFNMTLDNCWFERNATYDIFLNSDSGNWCEGTIRNCQFNPESGSTGKINLVQKSKVTIEGINGGNQCVVYGSNDASAILIKATNFTQSGDFAWTEIQPEHIIGTKFISEAGTNAGTPNNTPTTLVTLPNVNVGTWLVTAACAAASAANYSAISIVSTQNTTAVATPLKTATYVAISTSGLNIQGTQTTGGAYSIEWSITRIA